MNAGERRMVPAEIAGQGLLHRVKHAAVPHYSGAP
jgi:hypothetical protein